MGETSATSYRAEYEASLPPRAETGVKPDIVLESAADDLGGEPTPGPEGPAVQTVIDVSEPAWMIPGANEPMERVRTVEGVFEVPVSSILSVAVAA